MVPIARRWWCTPLIPALRRQRQADLCEFKASLVSRVSARIGSKATQRNPYGPHKLMFEYLVPGWWNCLGRIGSMSLRVSIKVSKDSGHSQCALCPSLWLRYECSDAACYLCSTVMHSTLLKP
ncbi:hypothetical protein I79_014050 [Cricetulus griseus]|uniref:Uncharacterized protein n=1 Tax=Cricetulus griseus TaxID=10029 RepID=G3HT39_CRIGR|nr:hypothetical protein I79_014050 [Cricetulus griseus]